MGAIAALLAARARASGEWRQWQTHPQIEDIFFSSGAVGLVSDDGHYFSIDRRSEWALEETNADRFSGAFPAFAAARRDSGLVNASTLTASDGTRFETKHAYCDEGDQEHHALSRDGVTIEDHVDPCNSIGALETADGNLWLGTYYFGETGASDAEGVVIQSLRDGKLVKRIKKGLPGGIVNSIRRDPYAGDVWIATNEGLARVGRGFDLIGAAYFREDFDALTRLPAVLLSTSPRKTDPFAYIGYRLKRRDAAYRDAVMRIPSRARAKMNLYEAYMGHYSAVNAFDPGGSFMPEEMNVLVPFLIEGVKSDDAGVRSEAAALLCLFNDDRVIAFAWTRQSRRPRQDDNADYFMDDCIRKYGKLELGPRTNPAPRKLSAQEIAALPKGCLDRRSFPDSIEHRVARPAGRSGLMILAGTSREFCAMTPGCLTMSKREFEQMVGGGISGYTDAALFALAPCKTDADPK